MLSRSLCACVGRSIGGNGAEIRWRGGQGRYCRRLIGLIHVSVNIERQPNGTVASQRLSELRGYTTPAEIGNERMPVGMEVGKHILVACVGEKDGCLAFGPFPIVFRIIEPLRSRCCQNRLPSSWKCLECSRWSWQVQKLYRWAPWDFAPAKIAATQRGRGAAE